MTPAKRILQIVLFITVPIWFIPIVVWQLFIREIWKNLGDYVEGKDT